MRAFLLLAVIAFSGCANTPEVRFVSEPLPLPARPLLPALSAEDVTCLSDEAYARLVQRDLRRRQYAEELEAIIRSTHEPSGATD